MKQFFFSEIDGGAKRNLFIGVQEERSRVETPTINAIVFIPLNIMYLEKYFVPLLPYSNFPHLPLCAQIDIEFQIINISYKDTPIHVSSLFPWGFC